MGVMESFRRLLDQGHSRAMLAEEASAVKADPRLRLVATAGFLARWRSDNLTLWHR